jgi:hypothetical protein
LVPFRHACEAKSFQIGIIPGKSLYGSPENVLINTESFTWWGKEILPGHCRDQTQPLDLAILHIEKTEIQRTKPSILSDQQTHQIFKALNGSQKVDHLNNVTRAF